MSRTCAGCWCDCHVEVVKATERKFMPVTASGRSEIIMLLLSYLEMPPIQTRYLSINRAIQIGEFDRATRYFDGVSIANVCDLSG